MNMISEIEKSNQRKSFHVLKSSLFGRYFFVDWTWGILATFTGFLFCMLNLVFGAKVKPTGNVKTGAVFLADCKFMPAFTGVSLGPFLFGGYGFSNWKHEFGHTLQNRLIGPLFFPVVGLPSFFSALRKDHDAHRELFVERWAEKLSDEFLKSVMVDTANTD